MGVASADRRRGVDGPATGSDATRRRGVSGTSGAGGAGGADASTISTSSPDETEDLDDDAALRTGSTRVGVAAPPTVVTRRGVVVVVVVVGAVRGRFEGVSGAKTSSFSDETDAASESEKATLRFVGLTLAREVGGGGGATLLVSRRADFVGDADRESGCDREGVLVGVFDELAAAAAAVADSVASAAFLRRISLIVVRMDSFRSTHSSSIALTRRENVLDDTPYFSTSDVDCTVES